MENAFGKHKVNRIKGLVDCNYALMQLQIITHIQDVNYFKLPHPARRWKLVVYP